MQRERAEGGGLVQRERAERRGLVQRERAEDSPSSGRIDECQKQVRQARTNR